MNTEKDCEHCSSLMDMEKIVDEFVAKSHEQLVYLPLMKILKKVEEKMK